MSNKLDVKVSNVQFDFSGDYDVDENYKFNLTEDYEGKIIQIEFDVDDEEYFEDYLIEALTDKISDISDWCVLDYDYEIVTVY